MSKIKPEQTDSTAARLALIGRALPDVPFDGWTTQLMSRAAQACGVAPATLKTLFPRGVTDFIIAFSAWADAQTLKKLEKMDVADMRVRDRIRAGVWARLEVLRPHRQALSSALGYLGMPLRALHLPPMVWRTADALWWAAGDTATDYNHYTKRALLSGVLTSTTLFWLSDESDDYADTAAFLDRRIDEVMQVGKHIGQAKSKLGAAKNKIGAAKNKMSAAKENMSAAKDKAKARMKPGKGRTKATA